MATRVSASVSLDAGDHLTREEFHRRYLARPDIRKAELIDGVVYVPSPVSFDRHAEPHASIVGWLVFYKLQMPDVRLGDNGALLLDTGVEVQPDAMLLRSGPGGPCAIEGGYVEGAPQLIVEVSASLATYDLHVKKEAYRRNGVAVYVVWRVLDEAIDWFRLKDGAYVNIAPDVEGFIESEQFPGLRLHVPSMLAGDLSAVLAAVRR